MRVRRAFRAGGAALWVVFGLGLSVAAQAETIPATDPRVRYVGRFDRTDPAGPRCAWSASAVALRVEGSSLDAILKETGQDFWEVYVDGQSTSTLQLRKGEAAYRVAWDLAPGVHSIELVKRTEFQVGSTQILGFELGDGGKLVPPPPAPSRRIEVLGDSISCGYGDEAPTKEEKYTPRRENASIAYGALAARQLGADYICVAWQGKKLWPNNSILDYYDRILPNGEGVKWDFASWIPDVVIVNLGTNDFGLSNPDGAGWTDAYRALVRRLRAQYPDAWIYAALGSMLVDTPKERKPASTVRGYLKGVVAEFNAAGDQKVRFIDFGIQNPVNGFGGSWHPSAKTHQLMAAQLVAALKKDLGWE